VEPRRILTNPASVSASVENELPAGKRRMNPSWPTAKANGADSRHQAITTETLISNPVGPAATPNAAVARTTPTALVQDRPAIQFAIERCASAATIETVSFPV
jgi:polygalacturonase